MGIALLLLAAAVAAPSASRVQAVATARIVEGTRIQLNSAQAVPEARRRVTLRQEPDRPRPTEVRLVEFQ